MIFRILSGLSFRILTRPTTSRGGCKTEERFADSTSHFDLGGRPTKAPFIKVFCPKEATMTWVEGAAAGVEAKQFQQALKARFYGEW